VHIHTHSSPSILLACCRDGHFWFFLGGASTTSFLPSPWFRGHTQAINAFLSLSWVVHRVLASSPGAASGWDGIMVDGWHLARLERGGWLVEQMVGYSIFFLYSLISSKDSPFSKRWVGVFLFLVSALSLCGFLLLRRLPSRKSFHSRSFQGSCCSFVRFLLYHHDFLRF
jgi:hypothetical protein